ncbi:agglutinin-like protein 6 serine rich [Scheffersomyces stipitis CBS 6054]|uniref:Agglutinin-like protein 6 serine rich n=2 Tax=Scheffersomyces stipitis TaxID=4924 RepID=A3LUG8_PICST|nr:agglutinin-like protein 6 serine rich [Scheffersomyces stipitis CBS 6054]ABN66587.2 agglutinin-like protein 6 serine rich [Scheffersomyces stipitis CBS 6054]AYM55194.1 agglutinin-like protein [Scheffersomyces stipitis]
MCILVFVLITSVLGAQLTDVFQSLEIINNSGSNRAQDIRTAKLTWKIEAGDAVEGDEFSLEMPNVFRTKFPGDQLYLVADYSIYASCVAVDGSYLAQNSYLNCTTTSSVVESDFKATGTLSFDFVFNAGGSGSEIDTTAASILVPGENKINWSGLQTTVNIDAGPFFAPVSNDKELVYFSRSTPQMYEQIFMLAGECNGGIVSGSIGMTTNDSLDCTQFALKATNNLNSFLLPETAINVQNTITCKEQSITFKFNSVANNYRVFLQGLEKFPTNSDAIRHIFAYSIQCGDGTKITKSSGQDFVVIDGYEDSSGSVEYSTVYTTTTWTETYLTTVTIPCTDESATATVIVKVPTSCSSDLESSTHCPGCESESSSSVSCDEPEISSDTSSSLSTIYCDESSSSSDTSSLIESSSDIYSSSLADTSVYTSSESSTTEECPETSSLSSTESSSSEVSSTTEECTETSSSSIADSSIYTSSESSILSSHDESSSTIETTDSISSVESSSSIQETSELTSSKESSSSVESTSSVELSSSVQATSSKELSSSVETTSSVFTSTESLSSDDTSSSIETTSTVSSSSSEITSPCLQCTSSISSSSSVDVPSPWTSSSETESSSSSTTTSYTTIPSSSIEGASSSPFVSSGLTSSESTSVSSNTPPEYTITITNRGTTIITIATCPGGCTRTTTVFPSETTTTSIATSTETYCPDSSTEIDKSSSVLNTSITSTTAETTEETSKESTSETSTNDSTITSKTTTTLINTSTETYCPESSTETDKSSNVLDTSITSTTSTSSSTKETTDSTKDSTKATTTTSTISLSTSESTSSSNTGTLSTFSISTSTGNISSSISYTEIVSSPTEITSVTTDCTTNYISTTITCSSCESNIESTSDKVSKPPGGTNYDTTNFAPTAPAPRSSETGQFPSSSDKASQEEPIPSSSGTAVCEGDCDLTSRVEYDKLTPTQSTTQTTTHTTTQTTTQSTTQSTQSTSGTIPVSASAQSSSAQSSKVADSSTFHFSSFSTSSVLPSGLPIPVAFDSAAARPVISLVALMMSLLFL